MNAGRIYADHNAQSPLRPEARAAVERVMATFGNPSSVHGEGRRAKAILDDAREIVAGAVGANAGDLIFTSGAAEANNLAIFGGAKAAGASAIFLSQLEHDSVWRAARATGLPIVEVPVTVTGIIDMNWLAGRLGNWDVLRDGRPFACTMLVSNETGVIQPVPDLAALIHRAGGFVLCDAVQGLGRVAIDIEDLGADYLSLSAHKVGGLAGSGALIVRGNTPLSPLIHGGGQERSRRAGTENLAGAAAFGAACGSIDSAELTRVRGVRDSFEDALRGHGLDVRIVADDADRVGNTSCIVASNAAAEMIVMAMDLADVACSVGAACSSGKVHPSRALIAMGMSEQDVKAAVRFSFGWNSGAEDGIEAAHAYAAIIRRVREQRAA